MNRVLPVLAASVVLLAGCGRVLSPPAAVVNGREISTDEVTRELEDLEASDEFQRLAEQEGDADRLRRSFEQG